MSKMDNNCNYVSIICEYCPYIEIFKPEYLKEIEPNEYECEGYFCMRAFNNYIKVTGDNRLIKVFFDDKIKNLKENKLYE